MKIKKTYQLNDFRLHLDTTTRKLDVTGLITRTKKGFYKLTKNGWKILDLLDSGQTVYNYVHPHETISRI